MSRFNKFRVYLLTDSGETYIGSVNADTRTEAGAQAVIKFGVNCRREDGEHFAAIYTDDDFIVKKEKTE